MSSLWFAQVTVGHLPSVVPDKADDGRARQPEGVQLVQDDAGGVVHEGDRGEVPEDGAVRRWKPEGKRVKRKHEASAVKRPWKVKERQWRGSAEAVAGQRRQ